MTGICELQCRSFPAFSDLGNVSWISIPRELTIVTRDPRFEEKSQSILGV